MTDQIAQFVPLMTRPTPGQARARARIELILSAAITLLEREKPGDLTACAIAAEAQIPVSSIYRYFPKIEDLVEELYLQAAADLRDALLAALEGDLGWRARLHAMLEMLRSFLTRHPYYRALLILIAARRGPQGLEHDFNSELVAALAARWAAGGDGFAGGDPQIIAATVVQMALALEELLLEQPGPARQTAYFNEMTRALEAYLGAFLCDARAVSPPPAQKKGS